MDTAMPEGVTALAPRPGAPGAGIYANWNVNVDCESGSDAPRDFGAWMQCPMLKWNGMSVVAQNSLAMGMPSSNGSCPAVGEIAGARLVNGPRLRGDAGSRPGWQWRRSPDGATWTDTAQDCPLFHYTPEAGDVGCHLRACVPARSNRAPEGVSEACIACSPKRRRHLAGRNRRAGGKPLLPSREKAGMRVSRRPARIGGKRESRATTPFLP